MSNSGYTLIYEPDTAGKKSVNELKSLLEKSKDDIKISAMKQIIVSVLNGDSMPELLMHIIRFVMPSKNKELKKLLYFYWEVCPKHDEEGKMRHEMILVCNAIQHDLQHPNEYIRGNTLRFLCKLKEPELLETLVPNVRQCLLHRHAYVRKNAVFALYSIYKVSDHLIPDAPALISGFLTEEFDSVCKRNAFVCLGELDRSAALQFMQDDVYSIENLDPILQLAFVEFIRKDANSSSSSKLQYAILIGAILETSSDVVVYEAAITLTVLSTSSQSIVLAGSKFVELATKETDNNVKIITLERINELNKKHPGLLHGLSLDILGVLSTQDITVRRKALEVTLLLISSRNVEDVVKLLKNELHRSSSSTDDKSSEYRQLLVNAIHQLAINFGEVATNVIDLLLESMGDLSTSAASDVITFVKEVVEKFPNSKGMIIKKLVTSMTGVKSGKVYRGALWILGEYSEDEPSIKESWKFLRSSIGEVPIFADEEKHGDDVKESSDPAEHASAGNTRKGPIILPDGTYATENALTTAHASSDNEDEFPIRKLVLTGDFYLASVLSSTFVKLVLRLERLQTTEKHLNALKAEALLIMVSILRFGESAFTPKKIDEDSADRILACVKFLTDAEDTDIISKGFLDDTKDAFKSQIRGEQEIKSKEQARDFHSKAARVDDAITFRQFEKYDGSKIADDEESLALTGAVKSENLISKLNKILQLTGFSDPIYAEAFVKVHQFDVTLDVLLVNQTTTTMRNLSVEFATLGDLKVVDKPSSVNIGPHGFHKVSVTVKVTSADTGVIFGNIVYDGRHSDESTIVILNDVHVDIMDYIKPATCSESVFRKMWNEFEWENKITIKSQMSSLKDYLEELIAGTNMTCLTPGAIAGEECHFLAANLYSRSSFGEDALANLCIEKQIDGPIIGHVRIRSKGQGLALSLGDRVASISRKTKVDEVTSV
ncbi:Coatomer, beta subunit [Metschnikowia bicuspidata var. bicuspidata NRRL YB-4993]|uniref:Coatomer subunit beta n=1 Tax=Metschnikowia bicuspidata var. bicuspidata NRRL YB-4993 TaxID=869754 RepID=A0A1A0HIX0_9ASCO|nr:Coatomer, beta subunit [Metschnikowia bicuspidata var. bicuspidata NRRL YB-4993]OBA23951.1 Coatomer, beta subunit [Metschnikowia bicuspidata var. bicuspidata NRRL YB-4993]